MEGVVMTAATETRVETPVDPALARTINCFAEAKKRIIEETGCSNTSARRAIKFITEMAESARTAARHRIDGPGTHHLTGAELETVGYRIMDQIMAHGAVARSGSAHEAVEQLVLKPGLGEFGLMHSNPSGRPEDCQVSLRVHAL